MEKLATREYADELVVLACATELKIRIVCVPHTPGEHNAKWAICTYVPLNVQLQESMSIHLGNHDAHYMWLAKP